MGPKGPFSDEAIELSWYQSIAVDFAKHGKCVDPQKYKHIDKLLTQWPDYMEKQHDTTRKTIESQHVLGYIYRKVECKDFYKRNIKIDHLYSIERHY